MNKKLTTAVFAIIFLVSVTVLPQIVLSQTSEPSSTPTPTEGTGGGAPDLLLIVVVIAVVATAVVASAAFIIVKKRTVNEKTLRKASPDAFEDWIIKRFNGKPSDPSTGVNGFTEGGQPLLIVQSNHVGLAEVENFVKVLARGRAQKGAIVAFNFDNDTLEGRVAAMDNGIELQLLRVNELVNKRFANRIRSLAQSQVTFEASPAYPTEKQVTETKPFDTLPSDRSESFDKEIQNLPQREGLKPRVFISNSNTKVADQVKRMLEFLHYDYVMGDKEETTVPISDGKFGLMQGCDCAIINIAAAEQERRYSGLYILNANVNSEINAAYLKYNMQVVLLVERKVDLPPNLKGLRRIEYDTDDLSFNAAMDLEKALADFKKT